MCRTNHRVSQVTGGVVLARSAIIGSIICLSYLLNLSYNIHIFYLRGVGDDPGWFAWLATHAYAWPMQNPPLLGGNFLSIHMSPIFFLSTALLHPFSGFPVAVRFCCFISLWSPLLWLALFLLLGRFPAIGFYQRCVVAVLLTFNGLMLSMVGFPHVEVLIPALGLLAMAVWLRVDSCRGWVLAVSLTLIFLAVREDGGLHLVLPLLAMIVVAYSARDRRTLRRLLALAAGSLITSVFALGVQAYGLPEGAHQLGNVYIGHPPFSQVSFGSIVRRLIYWATRREYIILPLLLMTATAVFCKREGRWLIDWRLLLGAAIAIPWLALSLIAASQLAGDLMSYYCFPLVFPVVWPLLLAQSGVVPSRRLLIIQTVMGSLSAGAMIVVGVLPFSGDGGLHDKAPWTNISPPSLESIRLTEEALSNRDGWLFDYGSSALVMGSLHPGQFRADLDFTEVEIREARGFIQFTNQPRFLAPRIELLHRVFQRCESVSGTALLICTRAP